jgi:hypothetical protein
MRDRLGIAAAGLLLCVLAPAGAQGQGDEKLDGRWIETSEEAGEIYYAEFDGGRIAIDIFDVQFGFFSYDEKQHRLAIVEEEGDRDSVGADDWVQIQIRGNKLTVSQEENHVVLDRVSRPEEADSTLVGRWQVNAEESSPEIVGDDRDAQMYMSFNNDGSASYEQLLETLNGTIVADPEQGTIEITINDNTESGTYSFKDGKLHLSFADENHVFERLE